MVSSFPEGAVNSTTSAASQNGLRRLCVRSPLRGETRALLCSTNSCISQRGTSGHFVRTGFDAPEAFGCARKESVARKALQKAAPEALASATDRFQNGISHPQTRLPYRIIAYWCTLSSERRRPNQLRLRGSASLPH